MSDFTGFPKQLPDFFAQLASNNTKDWFQAHKKEYETHVKTPSQQFVSVMGDKLKKLCPGINAIPKVNKSLFRINRDTRFSPDKSPYKTNLGILFWDGPGKRMESSGFYFHLEDNILMLGCGMHIFTKPAMAAFREAVVHKKAGPALEKTVDKMLQKGYAIGTKHYKRIPRGFEAGNDFGREFLLYSGLTARIELDIPDILFTPDIIDFVTGHFKAMQPLHDWIIRHL